MGDQSKKGFRGYITSRPIRGEMTPQHIQNQLIREYAKGHDLLFLLSATEYSMPSCYLILEEVLEAMTELEGIIFFTFFMLPSNSKRRRQVYERVLECGGEIHFVLENLVLRSEADIQKLEDIFLVQKFCSQVDLSELR